MIAIKNQAEKLRFILIGGINTVLDFGIFMALGLAGMPAIAANFISTTTAFSFSFYANKQYTFKAKTGGNPKKQFGLFLVITLFGLWVWQPIVITLVKTALKHSGLGDGLVLLAAKAAATCVTLVWNYTLYSRVVFKAPTTEPLVRQ